MLKWVLKRGALDLYYSRGLTAWALSAFKPTEHMMQTAAASIARFCHLCPGIHFPYDKILLWVGPAEEGEQNEGERFTAEIP